MDNFPRIHYITDSRRDPEQDELKYSVNLSNSQDESSSRQCTKTLCGEKMETNNCVLRVPKP